jgi:GT2 family glycosyltransferase
MPEDAPADIAIIIPAYRAEKCIEKALASILRQEGANLEVIVVVDGDYDRTAEIAAKFPGVRVLVNAQNMGSQAARNRGLAAVGAPFVAFVDADDYIEGPLHTSMLEALKADDVDMVFSPWVWERSEERGGRVPRGVEGLEANIGCNARIAADLLCENPCHGGATAWRTESLRAIGGWDPEIRRSQDLDVILRGLIAGLRPAVCREGRYVYVDHDDAGRITRIPMREIISSHVRYLQAAEAYARTLKQPKAVLRAAGARYYHLAARCFSEGSILEGRKLLAEARRLGLRGHLGSPMRRVVGQVIGLEARQRLFGLLRRPGP